jgi:uncharacterized membrane protein YbhN (UPF0104 family)
MDNHPSLKRYLHFLGSTLTIIGVLFVALRLRDYGNDFSIGDFNTTTWSGIIIFILIYGFANLMLTLAWWNLLMKFGIHTSRTWAIRTYGMTQLAKYAPGNIFHFAGKQAIGMAAGIPGWSLAKASIVELTLLTLAGAVFSILNLPRILPLISMTWAIYLFICIGCVITLSILRYGGPCLVRAFAWQCGFLTVSGFIFSGLFYLLLDNGSSLPWIHLCGAYILAWLAGMVTPGAPAGVGVRELVLLFVLKGLIPEADLLLAIVLGRVISVTGDLGFFGFTSFLKAETANKVQ